MLVVPMILVIRKNMNRQKTKKVIVWIRHYRLWVLRMLPLQVQDHQERQTYNTFI